ncbi:ABC transporter permease [Oceanirhabdus sp. W0125-5]|uniref:ABC transporter permease n=1 Tax=Oceanirhabdus sp. W0125-5 TaxID=2999116 RepID=UPI0022F2CBCD|nr:ABC transporter permease [Oceanirhabdus sp. W0125-5]WBW95636.1 ABC transporter permease [Oceanirhabdus sp. W0125-5]
MFKKIWTIFLRDLKASKRDFIALYIIVFPVLFAFGINLLTPSINDTTVNLALIEGENPAQVEYLKDFAKVEVFKDVEAVEKRIAKRDDIIGIIPDGEDYYILQQGNEGEEVVGYAKALLTFYEQDVQIEDTNAEIIELGRTVPPLKKLLVNLTILLTSILGGMLIALNIVDEKVDRTIRAMHLSPVSRIGYILGKSLIGILLPIYGTAAVVWITGFKNINVGQMGIILLVSTIISTLVGFIQGLKNDDIISAAANIKILFLPMAASIAAVELLGDKWQKFFYWSPFYWAYKGNDAVLSYSATWEQIIGYSLIVLLISAGVYVYLAPKIIKGLE